MMHPFDRIAKAAKERGAVTVFWDDVTGTFIVTVGSQVEDGDDLSEILERFL